MCNLGGDMLLCIVGNVEGDMCNLEGDVGNLEGDVGNLEGDVCL